MVVHFKVSADINKFLTVKLFLSLHTSPIFFEEPVNFGDSYRDGPSFFLIIVGLGFWELDRFFFLMVGFRVYITTLCRIWMWSIDTTLYLIPLLHWKRAPPWISNHGVLVYHEFELVPGRHPTQYCWGRVHSGRAQGLSTLCTSFRA